MSRPDGSDWRQTLFSKRTLGVRFGLEGVQRVDEALGRPASHLAPVQVLGTNGKGSTASMLAHALSRNGERVGLYTSPHLHRVGERVRIDGVPVDDDEIRRAVREVQAAEKVSGRELTFFELLTLAAWCIFDRVGVDRVVLEAGLGGRLDATSARTPCLQLFTAVGMDHQAYLGDTVEAIADEKFAVVRGGVPVLSAPQLPSVAERLVRRCAEANTSLRFVEASAWAPLPGPHQRINCALALAGWEQLSGRDGVPMLEAPSPAELFAGYRWPGRLESVESGAGEIVFDVAHNLPGVEAIVEALQPQPPDLVIFGTMGDKPATEMAARLGTLGAPMWWVPPASDGEARERPVEVSFARSFDDGVEDPAFVAALDELLETGLRVLVCGSHFLVAPLRARALGLGAGDEDPMRLSDPVGRSGPTKG